MARQVINRGNFPNDHAHADPIYVINGKINDMTLDLYSLQSQIISAGDARFVDLPTTEARISAARVQAALELKTIVSIPAIMTPHDNSLVDLTNASVRNVIEGGDYSVYDVTAYGVPKDGTTDISAAVQRVEDVRPAGATLKFPPATYKFGANTLATLMRIRTRGVWDFTGATFIAGSAPSSQVGAGGYSFGMLNVLAAGVDFRGGTLDANNAFRAVVAIESHLSGMHIEAEIKNLREEAGAGWTGLYYAVASDISGLTQTPCAKNVSGLLRRPACPIMDGNHVITSHQDVTAVIFGAENLKGLATGASGFALASVGTGNVIGTVAIAAIDTPGLTSGLVIQADENLCADLWVHDLAHSTAECGGGFPNIGISYGEPIGAIIGHLFKTGAISGWYHYNTLNASTLPPNVRVSGGASAGKGTVDVLGRFQDAQVALTWSTTPAVDLSLSNTFFLTATSNIAAVIQNPTNSPGSTADGNKNYAQRVRFTFFNNSGGALSTPITFGTKYVVRNPIALMDGQRATIEFTYDKTNDLLVEADRSPPCFIADAVLYNSGAGSPVAMKTFIVPASTLGANQGIRIKAWGHAANTAGNRSVQLLIGATQLASIACVPSTASNWSIDCTVMVRTVGNNTQSYFAFCFGGPNGVSPNYAAFGSGTALTFDSTASQTFTLQATQPGTDTLFVDGFTVEPVSQ